MGGGVSVQKNHEDKSYIAKLKRSSEASISRILKLSQKSENVEDSGTLPVDAGTIGVGHINT
jgi:hypothetical protein